MITYIKSALGQIKAEEDLVEETRLKLYDTLKKQNMKKSWFMKGSAWNMKKIVAVASAVVFACGMSIGGYAYSRRPIAYLSLDINPSVELGVNSAGQVVSADGYNADGKTILQGEQLKNTDVKTAVDDLVKSASTDGFISPDGSTVISITSETDNGGEAKELQDSAEQGANEALQSSGKAAVLYTTNVALARRDEARKLGITPGKLNLIQKLMALDPTATVDQYKNAKVTDIMKKIISLKKAAVSGADSGTSGDASSAAGSSSGAGTSSGVIASSGAVTSSGTVASSEDENDSAKMEKAVSQSVENANRKTSAGSHAASPAGQNKKAAAAAPVPSSSAAAPSKTNNGKGNGNAAAASSKSNGKSGNGNAGQNKNNAAVAANSKASANKGSGSVNGKTTMAQPVVSAAPACSKASGNANAAAKGNGNGKANEGANANANGKNNANAHSAHK